MPSLPVTASMRRCHRDKLAALSPADAATNNALRKILAAAAVSGGVGAGARGLLGLVSTLRTPDLKALTPQSTQPVSLGELEPAADRGRKPNQQPTLAKAANEDGSLVDWTRENVINEMPALLSGEHNTTFLSKPWAWPAMGAALSVPAITGWKAVSKLLEKKREHDLDTELEDARNEYQEALSGTKAASHYSGLDTLYSQLEKQALDLPQWMHNATGTAGGVGLSAALLAALLGGKMSYSSTMQRHPRKLFAESLRRRRDELQSRRPTPVRVVPHNRQLPQDDDSPAIASAM